MSAAHTFNPARGLIVIPTQIVGPSGTVSIRLALDTGASNSVVRSAVLVSIGYDPVSVGQRVQMTTASGVEFIPRLVVQTIRALGQEKSAFPLLAHTMPPTASVDGLLGLDFFRGMELRIDFRQGLLTLS
jgi:predicted aspartyl protease